MIKYVTLTSECHLILKFKQQIFKQINEIKNVTLYYTKCNLLIQ